MKRLTCALAALALVMWTNVPVKAEFGGRLPKDQEWTLEITNTTDTTTAVTVYYVDRRGLDVIGTLTVVGTTPVRETFPTPGKNVRRVIVEVDPAPGSQTTLTLNQTAPMTFEGGARLVFDTF